MKIAIDLGGTNIRVALLENELVKELVSSLCPAHSSEEVVFEAICLLIDKVINKEVDYIGIGVPSVVDSTEGLVYNVANIPSWVEVPIKKLLEDRYHVTVCVNNDANCFVLGAKKMLNVPLTNIVGLTLGTGLGCGLYLNGKLYNGSNTGAGEIGLIPYLEHDYEYYCSTPYFEHELHISAKKLGELAKMGDIASLDEWTKFGCHIGELCKAVLYMYDPDIIVIGGGISFSFPYFIDAVWATLDDFAYPNTVKKVRIKVCNDTLTGLLGGAMLCND